MLQDLFMSELLGVQPLGDLLHYRVDYSDIAYCRSIMACPELEAALTRSTEEIRMENVFFSKNGEDCSLTEAFEEHFMEHFLPVVKKAIHWKFMIGMVPLVFVKTASGALIPRVMESPGHIDIYQDRTTMKRYIYFVHANSQEISQVQRARQMGTLTFGMGGSCKPPSGPTERADRRVFVLSVETEEPTIDGFWRSKLYNLMGSVRMNKIGNNAYMLVTKGNAINKVFMNDTRPPEEGKPQEFSISAMDCEQGFGEDACRDDGRGGNMALVQQKNQEAEAQVMRQMQFLEMEQQDFDNRGPSGSVANVRYYGETGFKADPLPSMQLPKEFSEMRKTFLIEICAVLGLSPSYVFPQDDSSGAGNFRSTTGVEFQEQALIQAKLDLCSFVNRVLQFCYDRIFGDVDVMAQNIHILDILSKKTFEREQEKKGWGRPDLDASNGDLLELAFGTGRSKELRREERKRKRIEVVDMESKKKIYVDKRVDPMYFGEADILLQSGRATTRGHKRGKRGKKSRHAHGESFPQRKEFRSSKRVSRKEYDLSSSSSSFFSSSDDDSEEFGLLASDQGDTSENNKNVKKTHTVAEEKNRVSKEEVQEVISTAEIERHPSSEEKRDPRFLKLQVPSVEVSLGEERTSAAASSSSSSSSSSAGGAHLPSSKGGRKEERRKKMESKEVVFPGDPKSSTHREESTRVRVVFVPIIFKNPQILQGLLREDIIGLDMYKRLRAASSWIPALQSLMGRKPGSPQTSSSSSPSHPSGKKNESGGKDALLLQVLRQQIAEDAEKNAGGTMSVADRALQYDLLLKEKDILQRALQMEKGKTLEMKERADKLTRVHALEKQEMTLQFKVDSARQEDRHGDQDGKQKGVQSNQKGKEKEKEKEKKK